MVFASDRAEVPVSVSNMPLIPTDISISVSWSL